MASGREQAPSQSAQPREQQAWACRDTELQVFPDAYVLGQLILLLVNHTANTKHLISISDHLQISVIYQRFDFMLFKLLAFTRLGLSYFFIFYCMSLVLRTSMAQGTLPPKEQDAILLHKTLQFCVRMGLISSSAVRNRITTCINTINASRN